MKIRFKKRYIAAGIIFSAAYWIVESFVHLLFFWDGSISNWITTRDSNELWMRLLAVAIIMTFSVLISFIMGREERLKKKLKRSESRFEDLVSTLPQTVFEMDRKGRFTYANRVAFETFGYTDEDFDKGLYALDMIAPVDRERAAADMQRTFAGEEVEDTECFAIRKDGTTFPVSIHSTRIVEDGEVVGMRGITIDMSPIKEKDDRLRKMSRAVEHSPASVVITNSYGKIEYVNPEFTRITGYSMEEMMDKNPRILKSGLTPPERFIEMWRTISAGKAWRGILINKKKDGDVYWEDVRISPIHDASGEISHYVGIKEDITKRHILEEKLRSSEKKLRNILDDMQDTYYRTDNEGTLLSASPSLKELMGYEPKEIIGTKIADYYLHPELRERFLHALEEGNGSASNFMAEIKNKNGSIVWVSTNARYHTGDDGEVLGVEGTIRNVTALKEAQRKLEDYTAELESSNKLKELYIDIMAHDILNPVNVIKNATELVSPDIPEGKTMEFFNMIEESAEEIEDLICLAKKYSRLSTLVKADFVELDMDALIADVVKRFKLPMEKKEMEVRHIRMGNARIRADKLMDDVVSNLFSNAIKYGVEGGAIEIGLEKEKESLILFVKDEGGGIPDEHKEKIFNRFERLERGAIKGTGLGLAICKGIVQLHGGRIWVEDNPRGGSIFKVSLPKVR
ncbi:MAG: PAS domain S-box protein [bacterium]|nr:PAS domain S-box protein [bacterium]